MRIAFALCALATATTAAPKQANVKLPQSVLRAERRYQIEIGKIEAEAAKDRQKAAEELIESYRTALKAASSNSDFDRAKVYVERIKQLEAQSAASPAKSGRGITILSATWGLSQSWSDVTPIIQKMADGKTSWTWVPQDRLLIEPGRETVGKGKTLVIRYRYQGKVRLKAFYVGRVLKLP